MTAGRFDADLDNLSFRRCVLRAVVHFGHDEAGKYRDDLFLTVGGVELAPGQAVDLVLVVMNRRGLQKLVSNEFKIGVDAGVAAGPVGRDASAATDIQMRAEILSYSRSRGLFAGINGADLAGAFPGGDASGRTAAQAPPARGANSAARRLTASTSGAHSRRSASEKWRPSWSRCV